MGESQSIHLHCDEKEEFEKFMPLFDEMRYEEDGKEHYAIGDMKSGRLRIVVISGSIPLDEKFRSVVDKALDEQFISSFPPAQEDIYQLRA
jgi:hypothetical protein